MLALMSSSLPPWACITEPRYLKFSTCFRAFPVLSVICRGSAVLAHTIVSVLSAFTLRPLLSKASCHSPNLFWRLVYEISDKIRSSAYSMSHGTSCRTYSLMASMTIINSNGLRHDPWCPAVDHTFIYFQCNFQQLDSSVIEYSIILYSVWSWLNSTNYYTYL